MKIFYQQVLSKEGTSKNAFQEKGKCSQKEEIASGSLKERKKKINIIRNKKWDRHRKAFKN